MDEQNKSPKPATVYREPFHRLYWQGYDDGRMMRPALYPNSDIYLNGWAKAINDSKCLS